MANCVVIVICYDRPNEAAQLLKTLSESPVDAPVDLIVSIDRGRDQAQLASVADSVDWPHGRKRVIVMPERLGLKAHVLRCGDLIGEYDYGIVLEEDLLLSHQALRYARHVVAEYRGQARIAGYSLYAYHKRESDKLPFTPIEDGTDACFAQFCSSWGQVWTREQWQGFRQWLAENDADHFNDPAVPAFVNGWPASSWKKHFVRYMVRRELYFVFPRVGLSTNLGYEGTNHTGVHARFASPLLHGERTWVFPRLDDTALLYDADFRLGDAQKVRFQRVMMCPDVASNFARQGAAFFFAQFPLRAPFYLSLTARAIVNDLGILRSMALRWVRRRRGRS
ncbi:MAG: hypothetical protein R3E87_22150 [Burkholderiaceae bacterium]